LQAIRRFFQEDLRGANSPCPAKSLWQLFDRKSTLVRASAAILAQRAHRKEDCGRIEPFRYTEFVGKVEPITLAVLQDRFADWKNMQQRK
jgi:hypothetical protein